MKTWLISPRIDIGFIIAPGILAAVVAFGFSSEMDAPWWVYLFGVLLIDVAHVYSTLFRTYFNPIERVRRKRLLMVLPLAVGIGCGVINAFDAALFWRLLAYLAVFHFMKQQVGFSALYRAKQGLGFKGIDARVEKWAIMALVLGPVVWWHAHLPLHFSWFMDGDFISGLPVWVGTTALFVTAALTVWHLVLRIQSRLWSPGRDLWFLMTAIVWVGGIVLTEGDLQFTLTNVVAHGIPYMVLVGWTCHRQWLVSANGSLHFSFFKGLGFMVPFAMIALFAFVEEGLWDAGVWQENTWLFGTHQEPPIWLNLIAVGVLAIPQTTHYILDALIWKFRTNPGLDHWLDMPKREAS